MIESVIKYRITEPMSTLNHLNGNLEKRRRKNISIRKYLAQKGKQKKVGAVKNDTHNFFKKIDLLQSLNLQVIH